MGFLFCRVAASGKWAEFLCCFLWLFVNVFRQCDAGHFGRQ